MTDHDVEELAGRTGVEFTVPVEVGKVREFARATKSRNPEYSGGPGDTPLTPATFLMAASFWQTAEASPWQGVKRNWSRLLHGEQEFVFHGEPPRAGATLTGVSRIDKVYEKEGKRGGTMSFTETVTEFRDESGRLVAETRGTTLETSRATTDGDSK